MADEAKVAGKELEVREGARIVVESTVYEDKEKGRLLKDTDGRKVKVRPEDGARFVRRQLIYPFPAGLIRDEITNKAAENLTPAQFGAAVTQWLKDLETLKACEGRVSTTNKDGKVVKAVMPLDLVPDLPALFSKGFKLEIQGPLNAQMKKDHEVTVPGSKAAAKASTKDISGDLG